MVGPPPGFQFAIPGERPPGLCYTTRTRTGNIPVNHWFFPLTRTLPGRILIGNLATLPADHYGAVIVMTSTAQARTIGELKKSGYQVLPVRDELRNNLIKKIRAEEIVFPSTIRCCLSWRTLFWRVRT